MTAHVRIGAGVPQHNINTSNFHIHDKQHAKTTQTKQTKTYKYYKSTSMALATNTRSWNNQHTLHNTTLPQYKRHKYTPIRTDRIGKLGRWLFTYIKHNIASIGIDMPTNFNTHAIHNHKWSESTPTYTSKFPTCTSHQETQYHFTAQH